MTTSFVDDTPNWYDVLGVAKDASINDIKHAYHKRAFTLHPDRVGDDPEAARLFDLVAKAHAVLSDPAKRAAYDHKHAPLATLRDFLQRHRDGEHAFEVMLPSAPAAQRQGHHVAVVQTVPPGAFRQGGSTTFVATLAGQSQQRTQLDIPALPFEDAVALTTTHQHVAVARLRALGPEGKNQGKRGDFFVFCIPPQNAPSSTPR